MEAQARALFVIVHVLFVLLLALPQPALTPAEIDKPGVQAWFDRTHAKLLGLGLDLEREELVAWAAKWGGYYASAREVTLTPAQFYADWTGAKQSWRMFSDVSQDSARLRVEALDETGDWRPVYVHMDPAHGWNRAFFHQERVRTLINGFTQKKHRTPYRRFGRFLLPRLERDFPDAKGFRMIEERVAFPPPEELARTGELVFGERFWSTKLEPLPLAVGAGEASEKPAEDP